MENSGLPTSGLIDPFFIADVNAQINKIWDDIIETPGYDGITNGYTLNTIFHKAFNNLPHDPSPIYHATHKEGCRPHYGGRLDQVTYKILKYKLPEVLNMSLTEILNMSTYEFEGVLRTLTRLRLNEKSTFSKSDLDKLEKQMKNL